jgi:hypothetical protein
LQPFNGWGIILLEIDFYIRLGRALYLGFNLAIGAQLIFPFLEMDEKKRLENIKKGKALAEKCVAKHGMYAHRPIEMNQLEVRNPAMYKLAYCARKRSTIKKLIGIIGAKFLKNK